MSDTLAVITARGGSTELKRKNLLPVDGTPMFLKSAQAARDAGCEVVVSTDDPEIRSTAIVAGFRVHDRGPELADVVVDDVVKAAVAAARGPSGGTWNGSVLLVQPTVQPITPDIIGEMLTGVMARHTPVPQTLVKPDDTQMWRDGEWLTERVNRQEHSNPLWAELGIRWWPTVSEIGDRLSPWGPLAVTPLVDIDTAADYRSITVPKRIALWPIASTEYGMGHVYRCLAIAERLQHHDIVWMLDDLDTDAQVMLAERGWGRRWTCAKRGELWPVDLWILDRLDNSDMPHLPGNVIAVEDQSAYQADVKIDALYADGADWCVLRPEFTAGTYEVREHVKRVMLLFGGTDPSGLGDRVNTLLHDRMVSTPGAPIQLDWVKAGDNRPIAEAMHQADLLITSAGRTVYEAAAVGIPTIVLAQNLRETTHQHLGYEHGNVYLGLGSLVTDQQIVDTIRTVSDNVGLRRDLSVRGRPDGLGLSRIIHTIEGLLGGL